MRSGFDLERRTVEGEKVLSEAVVDANVLLTTRAANEATLMP